MKEKITAFVVLISWYIGCIGIGYGASKLICLGIDKIENRIHEYKKAKKNHG